MERSTVGSLLRSTQAFCQQICEKQTFDFGIAFYSHRFPSLPDANQIREVTAAQPHDVAHAFEQASAWLDQQGLKCLRWSTAIGVDPSNMKSFLTTRGFHQRSLIAFHLAQWTTTHPSPNVRVLPARALRDAFRQTFLNAATPQAPGTRSQLADSFAERLDDPQLDMFVALVDGQPAGRCGLHQVGDIARVIDLSVLPAFDAHGVAGSLLAHTLALARRLTMPMVVAQAREEDAARRTLLSNHGFVEDGVILEFELDSPFFAVPPV